MPLACFHSVLQCGPALARLPNKQRGSCEYLQWFAPGYAYRAGGTVAFTFFPAFLCIVKAADAGVLGAALLTQQLLPTGS